LVSCAAAIETLNLISGKKVLDNVVKTGDYFYKKLTGLKNKYPGIIKEARGAGLMLGIELVADSGAGIVEKCLKKGLIINCTQSKILRFLPPFTITKKDVDSAIRILSECLR
ncbi:MAG: aminotransferase class III-fold pyridoxal phosphate-dependent enzyme, partial [Elusimicrobiota bacterium]